MLIIKSKMVDKTTTQVIIVVVGLGVIYWINQDKEKKQNKPQITILPPPPPAQQLVPPKDMPRSRNMEDYTQLIQEMRAHQEIEYESDWNDIQTAFREYRTKALKERRGRYQQQKNEWLEFKRRYFALYIQIFDARANPKMLTSDGREGGEIERMIDFYEQLLRNSDIVHLQEQYELSNQQHNTFVQQNSYKTINQRQTNKYKQNNLYKQENLITPSAIAPVPDDNAFMASPAPFQPPPESGPSGGRKRNADDFDTVGGEGLRQQVEHTETAAENIALPTTHSHVILDDPVAFGENIALDLTGEVSPESSPEPQALFPGPPQIPGAGKPPVLSTLPERQNKEGSALGKRKGAAGKPTPRPEFNSSPDTAPSIAEQKASLKRARKNDPSKAPMNMIADGTKPKPKVGYNKPQLDGRYTARVDAALRALEGLRTKSMFMKLVRTFPTGGEQGVYNVQKGEQLTERSVDSKDYEMWAQLAAHGMEHYQGQGELAWATANTMFTSPEHEYYRAKVQTGRKMSAGGGMFKWSQTLS